MRTFRFIISVIIVFVVVFFMVAVKGPFATAQVEEDELKAVYPNHLLPGINQPCPRDSQKMFIGKFSVPRHTRIKEFGEFLLVTKRGNVLSDTGYRVDRRHVEFYLFPRSRKAKVNVYDMRFNLAYAAYTSHDYTFELSKDCVEKLP